MTYYARVKGMKSERRVMAGVPRDAATIFARMYDFDCEHALNKGQLVVYVREATEKQYAEYVVYCDVTPTYDSVCNRTTADDIKIPRSIHGTKNRKSTKQVRSQKSSRL